MDEYDPYFTRRPVPLIILQGDTSLVKPLMKELQEANPREHPVSYVFRPLDFRYPTRKNPEFSDRHDAQKYAGKKCAGVMKVGWYRKHQESIPALVMPVFSFDAQLPTSEWHAMESKVVEVIQDIKRQLSPRKSALHILFVHDKNYPRSRESQEVVDFIHGRLAG